LWPDKGAELLCLFALLVAISEVKLFIGANSAFTSTFSIKNSVWSVGLLKFHASCCLLNDSSCSSRLLMFSFEWKFEETKINLYPCEISDIDLCSFPKIKKYI
jgi:hypothetical protein